MTEVSLKERFEGGCLDFIGEFFPCIRDSMRKSTELCYCRHHQVVLLNIVCQVLFLCANKCSVLGLRCAGRFWFYKALERGSCASNRKSCSLHWSLLRVNSGCRAAAWEWKVGVELRFLEERIALNTV